MDPDPDPGGQKTCGSGRSATLLSIFRLRTHSVAGFLDHFSPLINSFRVFLFLTLSCFILSLSPCVSFSLSSLILPPPLPSSSPGSDDSICGLCCLDRIYLLFYCVETDTRPDSRTINSRGGRSTNPLLYLSQRKRWNMMVFWLRQRACTVQKRWQRPSSALLASDQAESVIYLPVCPFCHVFLEIVANAGKIHKKYALQRWTSLQKTEDPCRIGNIISILSLVLNLYLHSSGLYLTRYYKIFTLNLYWIR